jgi:hypothetical protein
MASSLAYAEQLLPTVLENRAKAEPRGVFAKVPLSNTAYEAGFRSVTFGELVKAINRTAWLLESQFGRGEHFPTITYLGPSDLRYSIVLVAAIKVGYKVSIRSMTGKIDQLTETRRFCLLLEIARQHFYRFFHNLSAHAWLQHLQKLLALRCSKGNILLKNSTSHLYRTC